MVQVVVEVLGAQVIMELIPAVVQVALEELHLSQELLLLMR
jgi:hypothetical protein